MLSGLSIRALVTLLVVVPVAATSVALAWLSHATASRVAGELARSLVDAASARASAEISHHLEPATRLSDMLAGLARDGALPTGDLLVWEPLLIRSVLSMPTVAAVTFAPPDGSSVMVMRNGAGVELGRVRAGGNDRHEIFAVDGAGAVGTSALRTERYDARERPWYGVGVSALTPMWTPIYTWFVAERGQDSTIGTGYVRAVRDRGGALLGVLLVDVTLGDIAASLRALPLAQTGRVLIVDDGQRLVASSVSHVVRDDGERFALSDRHPEADQDRLQRSAAAAMRSPVSVDAATGAAQLRRFRVDAEGGWSRAKVMPVRPWPGIDWRIITILPEAVFMGAAERARGRSLVLAGLASVASVGLALLLSRRLVGPIEAVRGHVRRLGDGDFSSRLDLRGSRELVRLSRDLNTASAHLAERMELRQSLAVAMEVQQSLLPRGDPRVEGLDVAGRTRYCDATGGDYFDFIPAESLGHGQTLLVLGDVMGHGVAAALLMATARAALRTHALDGDGSGGLAGLLAKVNRVLAADPHQRFMTLSLVVVDVPGGRVRWASAGHEPALLYRPWAEGGVGSFVCWRAGTFRWGWTRSGGLRSTRWMGCARGTCCSSGRTGSGNKRGPRVARRSGRSGCGRCWHGKRGSPRRRWRARWRRRWTRSGVARRSRMT